MEAAGVSVCYAVQADVKSSNNCSQTGLVEWARERLLQTGEPVEAAVARPEEAAAGKEAGGAAGAETCGATWCR